MNLILLKSIDEIVQSNGFSSQNPKLLEYFNNGTFFGVKKQDIVDFENIIYDAGKEITKLFGIIEKIKLFY